MMFCSRNRKDGAEVFPGREGEKEKEKRKRKGEKEKFWFWVVYILALAGFGGILSE